MDPNNTTDTSSAPPHIPVSELAATLLDGDRAAARELVARSLVRDGTEPTLGALVPGAMHLIGDRWECGEIGVGDEHVATGTLVEVLALVRDSVRSIAPSAGRIVLCTPPGERHELALTMLALRLEHVGWEVRRVGCDLPAVAVHDVVRAWEADSCAISVSITDHRTAALELARGLEDRGVRAVLGGSGIDATITTASLAALGIGQRPAIW